MSLRTKLLWLFAPPLLLVLLLSYVAAHALLLERLDKQDERLLVIEAGRMRALLGSIFERDADRLQQLAESLPRPIGPAFPLPAQIFSRTGFDFFVLVTDTGQRAAWKPLDPETFRASASADAGARPAVHSCGCRWRPGRRRRRLVCRHVSRCRADRRPATATGRSAAVECCRR